MIIDMTCSFENQIEVARNIVRAHNLEGANNVTILLFIPYTLKSDATRAINNNGDNASFCLV